MIDNDDIMLDERQVYEVRREEDNALIGVMYTRKTAQELLEEYYNAWQEECRIAVTFIDGQETIGQRNANNEA